MSKAAKIAVLGAGSWGIALANHYRRLGHQVVIWGNDPAVLEEIRQTGSSSRYFPGTGSTITGIEGTEDIEQALRDASLVVMALPSSAVRSVLAGRTLPADTLVVSVAKGLEEGSNLRMSEVIRECLGSVRVGALSGPSFALEVLRGVPTAVTVASESLETAELISSLTHGDRFRVYTTDDLVGVELGGTLKNVLAIAAGVVDGAGLGFNARAALLTRGLSELQRLVIASGGRAETVVGLSGLGDLILTATSDLSRNRRVGLALGRGGNLENALKEIGQVTEGVDCARQAVELGESLGVSLPICSEVLALLEGRRNLQECIQALLARAPRQE
jgi:glycerol-3-phosphate dehydrogenase (NAD(P)+)